MELVGEGFSLREWRRGDEESLVYNANNKKIKDNLTDIFPHPYTLKDAQEWIRLNDSGDTKKMNLAIIFSDKAVGGIGFSLGEKDHHLTGTLGYWLGEDHWNKGLMTKATKLFIKYVFENFDIERLQGFVYPWNPASSRVLEKCGFKHEGLLRRNTVKDGKVVDEHVFSIVRKEYADVSRNSH